jgi:hypothetical protein
VQLPSSRPDGLLRLTGVRMRRPSTTVGILAVTQIVSWGSLYYAFTILAPGIRRDLNLAPEVVFGAFSWALLVAGLAAAPVGILLTATAAAPSWRAVRSCVSWDWPGSAAAPASCRTTPPGRWSGWRWR